MLDNGLTPVTNRLWFVSEAVVTGHFLDLQEVEDDAMFRTVTDVLGLDHVPAVVFDPRVSDPETRYYPSGLGYPEVYEIVDLGTSPVTLDRIFAAIDRVYDTCLVTPDVQVEAGKLWTEKEKRWPAQDAEGRIQVHLKAGLSGAFPTCTVRHEQPGVGGRLDLQIEQADPDRTGTVTQHATLELKVLRSFRSTGRPVGPQEMLDWVESGVKQAFAYGKDRSARATALCCFDMRKEQTGEACFDHVRDTATELAVRLRVWFLFASAEEFREVLARQASGETSPPSSKPC